MQIYEINKLPLFTCAVSHGTPPCRPEVIYVEIIGISRAIFDIHCMPSCTPFPYVKQINTSKSFNFFSYSRRQASFHPNWCHSSTIKRVRFGRWYLSTVCKPIPPFREFLIADCFVSSFQLVVYTSVGIINILKVFTWFVSIYL